MLFFLLHVFIVHSNRKTTKPRAKQQRSGDSHAETLAEQLQRVSHGEDMMMQLKRAAAETVDHNKQIK
jgi:hypothetical protein